MTRRSDLRCTFCGGELFVECRGSGDWGCSVSGLECRSCAAFWADDGRFITRPDVAPIRSSGPYRKVDGT